MNDDEHIKWGSTELRSKNLTADFKKPQKVSHPRDWVTLTDAVVKHLQDKTTNTEEFRALLQFFGRDKIVRLFREWKEKK